MINPNDIFLKGKHIILKALSEDDIINSNWYGWFNNQETTQYMQQHYFPNTQADQMQFYRTDIVSNRSKIQLGICDIHGEEIVGVVSLQNIDFLNQKAEIALIIGEKEYRKAQYVLEIFQLMLDHAFFSLNMHKVYGGSLWNELVEFYCRTVGFKREGCLRQDAYKNGKFHDMHLYSILKDEYINISEKKSGQSK